MAGLTPSPVRRLVVIAAWVLAALGAGVVIGALLPAASRDLASTWDANRQALVWLVERLLAFLAYLAMTGSVVYGLALTTRLLDTLTHRAVSYTLHQDLASIGVGMAAVHAMLLTLDASLPFSLAQVLVPGSSPHEPLAVAFGQVALYLAIVVLASFYVRSRLPRGAWRALHYLTFLAWLGATVHGIASGSDSGEPWAQLLYVGSGAVVAFLFAYRAGMAVIDRAGRGPVSRARAELERVRG